MLSIYCPYCNEMRDEEEFSYSGEAHIKRPEKPFELQMNNGGSIFFLGRILQLCMLRCGITQVVVGSILML